VIRLALIFLLPVTLPGLFVPPALAGDAASPASPPRTDVDAVLASFDDEPPVELVQLWATGEAMADPARAARLVRDARARGALPLIRLRGRYKDSAGQSWDELNLLDSRDKDSDYTLDVWLEWDLADVASSVDLMRSVREGRELVELRQAILHQVTIAYFDRRRLLCEERLASPQEPLAEGLERRLRVQELNATLDALTGGRWSRSLPPRPEPATTPDVVVAQESQRESTGEDPDPGLRVPVHPADRATRP